MKKTIMIIALLLLVLFLVGCTSSASAPLGNFAQCLSEKGVVMYGAYWCPHCQNQKEMFGNAWNNIVYVECSLLNKGGQTQECKDLDINGYPTWEFSDGSRIEGEATFEQLAQKTGCALAQEQANG